MTEWEREKAVRVTLVWILLRPQGHCTEHSSELSFHGESRVFIHQRLSLISLRVASVGLKSLVLPDSLYTV